MKKRKLTKEQKLKNEIGELQKKLEAALDDASYYRGKYDGIKNEMDAFKEQAQVYSRRIEGVTNPLYEENTWLKDTLRMLIVPKGKEEDLAKAIETERQRRSRGRMF